MAKTNKAKAAVPYARRLLEDEYVQEQLREAVSGLRAAYERARSERAQATEDKRLYGHLRQAATATRKATLALRRPQPKPKRRVRKIAVLAFAVGGCALLTIKLQKQRPAVGQPSEGGTGLGGTPAGAASSERITEAEPGATPPVA
jgi:ferric-dicitrate binding protein FerR (iron transport regulator)